jgi:hypothetical protein
MTEQAVEVKELRKRLRGIETAEEDHVIQGSRLLAVKVNKLG